MNREAASILTPTDLTRFRLKEGTVRFMTIPELSVSKTGSHIAEYTHDRLSFMRRVVTECGALGRASFQGRPVLVVSGPEVMHETLVEKAKAFRKWPLIRLVLYPLIGEGLFTSEGTHWRSQRRLMAPIFKPDQVATYAQHMTQEALRSVLHVRDGEGISVADLTTRIAMGVVGRSLFDADMCARPGPGTGHQASEADQLAEALTVALRWTDEQVARVPTYIQLALREWLEGLGEKRPGAVRRLTEHALDYLELPLSYRLSRRKTGVRAAVQVIDASIERMLVARRKAGLAGDDLLTRLLRARSEDGTEGLTDRQIRDQAVNLFIGGHETTATAMAWALHELAKAPALYRQVQAEGDALGGRTPRMDELRELSTCMRVFKEALRMYPPVYAYGRQAIEDLTIGGYEIPKGTVVLASAYGMHHNPAVYPEPERFDPDRFLPEVESARHRSAWVPFGNGPRVCIGNHFGLMEGQLVLAALSHRIEFQASPGSVVLPEPGATLRPNGPMTMTARLRNRSEAPQPAALLAQEAEIAALV